MQGHVPSGRAAPQGIKGPERALWADVSVLEPSGCHARRERRVDREMVEPSEINGRDTSGTPHSLGVLGEVLQKSLQLREETCGVGPVYEPMVVR